MNAEWKLGLKAHASAAPSEKLRYPTQRFTACCVNTPIRLFLEFCNGLKKNTLTIGYKAAQSPRHKR